MTDHPPVPIDVLLERISDFVIARDWALDAGKWADAGRRRAEFREWCRDSGLNVSFPEDKQESA